MAPRNAFILPTNYALSTGRRDIGLSVGPRGRKLCGSIDSRVLGATVDARLVGVSRASEVRAVIGYNGVAPCLVCGGN